MEKTIKEEQLLNDISDSLCGVLVEGSHTDIVIPKEILNIIFNHYVEEKHIVYSLDKTCILYKVHIDGSYFFILRRILENENEEIDPYLIEVWKV